MRTLYDRLKKYRDSDFYGFHMPGHKRRNIIPAEDTGEIIDLPYGIDITEIEGFDDLHHADGILLDAQRRAAEVYHAGETHFLINGSTVGILSAICGVTKKGDTILVARNCHKSVYHAIYMNELHPVYLYPDFDSEMCLNAEIHSENVAKALELHPDIRAVVIVSPTYDGVVSDVAAIADAVHKKGIPLIVDEAHGAHFGFHEAFPKNANERGADLVIHSVHKTLPSLTQTALLHMNGEIADRVRVKRYLDMLQTSSPSYVLMASIDACIDLLSQDAQALFEPYVSMLFETRDKLSKFRHLALIGGKHYDDSKLVISVKNANITSRELYKRLLSEYHLQMEMVAGSYVLAMTSVADTREGFERLADALLEIDSGLGESEENDDLTVGAPRLKVVLDIAGAEAAACRRPEDVRAVSWNESAGSVSLEYAYLYPPGIPLIVPGERITKEAAEMLCRYTDCGFSIEGLKEERYIEVLVNE